MAGGGIVDTDNIHCKIEVVRRGSLRVEVQDLDVEIRRRWTDDVVTARYSQMRRLSISREM